LEVSEKHDVMMIRWERILLENMNDIKWKKISSA
jgi:hypothetical protein